MPRLKNRKQIGHHETITPNPSSHPASGRTLGLLTSKRAYPNPNSDSRYPHAYTYASTTYPNPNGNAARLPDPTGACG